jgi:2-hydroxychromene-2-carboxylate isomerase
VGTSFKLTGRKPLLEVPLVREYMAHDVERFARLLEIPFTLPDRFPIAAVTASRGFYWLAQQDAEVATSFAKRVYHAYFAKNQNITSKEELADLASSLRVDRDQWLAGVQSQSIKDRFRQEHDRALERGVFGSPFIIVDGEAFWGADRLPQVEQWLSRSGW